MRPDRKNSKAAFAGLALLCLLLVGAAGCTNKPKALASPGEMPATARSVGPPIRPYGMSPEQTRALNQLRWEVENANARWYSDICRQRMETAGQIAADTVGALNHNTRIMRRAWDGRRRCCED
jgi:hypothetical protein